MAVFDRDIDGGGEFVLADDGYPEERGNGEAQDFSSDVDGEETFGGGKH
jgi:hypothetical protein